MIDFMDEPEFLPVLPVVTAKSELCRRSDIERPFQPT
jgi:hypothetical protein